MRKSTIALLILALVLLSLIQESVARSRSARRRRSRDSRPRRRYRDDYDDDYDRRRSSRRRRDDYDDDDDEEEYSDDEEEYEEEEEEYEEERRIRRKRKAKKEDTTETTTPATATTTSSSTATTPVAAATAPVAEEKPVAPVPDQPQLVSPNADKPAADTKSEKKVKKPKVFSQEVGSEKKRAAINNATLTSFDTTFDPESAPSISKSNFESSYKPASADSDDNEPEGTIRTKSNTIDSPLNDIVWCGEKKDVVFILTNKGLLYRSVDDVFSGQVVTEHLRKLGRTELGGDGANVGMISAIVQSPLDPNLLLIIGTKHVNWVTENCGASFRAMDQGRPVDEFQFHPTERDWILASAWTLADDFQDTKYKRYKELFVSKDLGKNFNFVAHYVFDYSWGIVDQTFFRTPKDRIVITHDPEGRGNQTNNGWKTKLQVSYSDDYFNKTTNVLAKGGNRFLLTTNFFFIVVANDDKTQDVTLLVADPRQLTYTFNPAEIPNARILDHGYTVLDASESSVFLHVDHSNDKSPFGNIYISDSTGVRFTSALKNNVRDLFGQADFERLEGLDGVYLANVYDNDAVKRHQKVLAEMESSFPTQKAGSKKTSKSAYKKAEYYNTDTNANAKSVDRELNIDDFKKTMITFDKGGIWQPLSPPETDFNGKRIICPIEEECNLHLHSISSSKFGPFYSTENSLGLIIGTGNIGAYLSNVNDEVNTYLSRDAGQTWYEIAKGSHIYEVGDHGGLIVMAPNQKATKEVFYSWNEGLTWTALLISETPLEVTNIIIEPTNTGEKFVVYGRQTGRSGGTVIAVDFSTLHQRVCQQPEAPNTPTSDYERWTPSATKGVGGAKQCLLGREISYTRRKREAQCFNPEEFEAWSFVDHCTCTEEDWECEMGYSRDGNGPCVPDSEEISKKVMLIPEQCDSYYYITQGYRKIPTDSCQGGIDHTPLRLPCPGTGVFSSKNLGYIIMLVGTLLTFVWLSNSANQKKVKTVCDFFRNRFSFKWKRSSNARRFGYENQIPENSRDDENHFSNGIFEEMRENEPEPTIDVDLKDDQEDDDEIIDENKVKKMTGSSALDGAKKKVPLLAKPGEKKAFDI